MFASPSAEATCEISLTVSDVGALTLRATVQAERGGYAGFLSSLMLTIKKEKNVRYANKNRDGESRRFLTGVGSLL